jgi:hypothetical protein
MWLFRFIAAAALTSIAISLAFASQPGLPVARVTASAKTITLQEHGINHDYAFTDSELVMHAIDTIKLLFQSRRNGSLYLLLDARGPSRGAGGEYGQCGAGQEQYLVWLNLDANWQLRDRKLELISSCFMTIESSNEEPYEIRQGRLTANYENYNDKVRTTLTYDSAKPEKAWLLHQEPLPAK